MTPTDFRAARESLGLSQTDLAPLLGFGSSQGVSNIERGVRNPGAAVALLMQAYLDGYRPADWPG
jgi:DNA-binding transcriptional regulator YiaG